jgi:hypothetical protein
LNRDRSVPGKAQKRRKIIAGILLLIAACFLVIGPWPVLQKAEDAPAFRQETLSRLDSILPESLGVGRFTAPLRGGVGTAEIRIPDGTPLAGYGKRKGAPNQGFHDPLMVKALALDDGADRLLMFGADLLIMPPSVAETVYPRLEKELGLAEHQVLFTASHTHSGPGAFAPELVGKLFAGTFDPAVVNNLAEAFISAASSAWESLQAVEIATDFTTHPSLVENRLIPNGSTHARIPILAVRDKSAGPLAIATGFSAHPTILGDENLQFSGDYPGAFQRELESLTGATAVFLGGAVGSMGPKPPEQPEKGSFAAVEAMGKSLAEKVHAELADLDFTGEADLASISIAIELPHPQWRLNTNWKLSPVITRLLIPMRSVSVHAMRIGDQLWFGTPCDFSGELAEDIAERFERIGVKAEICSFNGAYIGYVVPDRYYDMPSYETRVMSWFGPGMGSAFTAIMVESGELLVGGVDDVDRVDLVDAVDSVDAVDPENRPRNTSAGPAVALSSARAH